MELVHNKMTVKQEVNKIWWRKIKLRTINIFWGNVTSLII